MRSVVHRSWAVGAALGFCTVPVEALVNLDLRTSAAQVPVGETVDVGIYAVASGADEPFSGLDAILSWDETRLELQEAIANGPHAWSFQFGLLDDSALDGLNDSLLDGNALFQAASFSTATATPEGMLVATLRFVGVGGTPETTIAIEPTFGVFSRTQVLAPGGLDVTGDLLGASIAVAGAVPAVSAWGLILLALLIVTAGGVVIDRPGKYRCWPGRYEA